MNTRSRKSGFTLVELLTVIAIIAILAAIIFPVMGSVKENARRSQCMTNLKNIGMGIELFKTDNRRYPDVLGAHWASGVNFDSANDPNGLFREYVKSEDIFRCPSTNFNSKSAQAGPYPKYTYDPSGPDDLTTYTYNSYEVGISGGVQTRHYTLGWAKDTGSGSYNFTDGTKDLQADPSVAGSPTADEEDYARQLRFRNPPDNTVVTWCSYHEKPDGSGGVKGDALVLFKGGNVQAIPANIVEECKWRTRPKG